MMSTKASILCLVALAVLTLVSEAVAEDQPPPSCLSFASDQQVNCPHASRLTHGLTGVTYCCAAENRAPWIVADNVCYCITFAEYCAAIGPECLTTEYLGMRRW